LVYFSKLLERLIEKVWRKGPYSRIREKKAASASRGSGKGEEKAVAIRVLEPGQERRRQEDYEPTNAIHTVEVTAKRWEWERVEAYFGVMVEYERAGESSCHGKYGAEVLREI